MADAKSVSTPMSTMTTLDPDEDSEAIDQRKYGSMIGSLLYLTVTLLDIQFIVCFCAFFTLPHTLCIIKQFNEYSSISNKLLILGFGILLLLHWILLDFWMLILLEVVLIERALLVPAIFGSSLICWSSKK
jgi:hypothetical protein